MIETATDRMRKVKSILVTQEAPTDANSPYLKLAEKYGLKIDFRPFIQVDAVPIKDFRKQKIDILQHTAIILTSRHAVDHFFSICRELKIEMPPDMKYFCISDQTSNYLQKYIVIRKRKIFSGLKDTKDLLEIIKKHKNEKFLFPCSDIRKSDIPDFLTANGLQFFRSHYVSYRGR
jgi:uroporphyrinogen-III synthase